MFCYGFKMVKYNLCFKSDGLLLNKFNNLLYWCRNLSMSTTNKNEMNEYPEASRSILTEESLDDLLDSTDSEDEARRRIQEFTRTRLQDYRYIRGYQTPKKSYKMYP